MRHYSKSHGRHCYLRSFQTSCKKCGADVLYWECTHGSKIFFEYPPYGKLQRHLCRKAQKNKKNSYPVIVKAPKGLLEDPFFTCPVCGKIFKNNLSLKDHIKQAKKNDSNHKLFFENKMFFENHKNGEYLGKKNHQTTPKFGRIYIKNPKTE